MKYLLIFFYLIFFIEVNAQEVHIKKINKYFNEITSFDSNFLQIEHNVISEGKIYYSVKRLRVEYMVPQNLVFVMKKNSVMYFNKDLQEVQYFDPKETPAEIFFNIFTNSSFFDGSEILKKEGYFIIKKEVFFENEKHIIEIYFEERPTNLRKIVISGNITNLTFAISNLNLNSSLDKSLFSLANPLLK